MSEKEWMADERRRALDCASRAREARAKAHEENRQGHDWAMGYWLDQVQIARDEERDHIRCYYRYKRKAATM